MRLLLSPAPALELPTQNLQRVCAWCETILAPGIEPATHGICPICKVLYWDLHCPALMAPLPSRLDCYRCRYVDLDSDGVADGCSRPHGQNCELYPDRRNL